MLPFGTTCSPCCAIYTLQRLIMNHSKPSDDVRATVEKNFYVDNCLQSLRSPEEAKQLVDKLCQLLASDGFDLRQWASNVPSVVEHLPADARSNSTELWLSQDRTDIQESTLGLKWHCQLSHLSLDHVPFITSTEYSQLSTTHMVSSSHLPHALKFWYKGCVTSRGNGMIPTYLMTF